MNANQSTNKTRASRMATVSQVHSQWYREMSLKFNQIKKELDISDTMPFGKYQGLTLARIIQDDVKYIRWMMENSEQFFVSDKVHDLITQVEYKKHLNQMQSYYSHVVDYDMEEDVPF